MLCGNFISNQTTAHTQDNAILNIKVTKNGTTGKMSIDSVDYVPVYVWNKGSGVKNRYELMRGHRNTDRLANSLAGIQLY